MSAEQTQSLHRYRVAEIPLLQHVVRRLGIEPILRRYLPAHGNEKVAAVESLLLLTYNITCGRQPLYELPLWTTQLDGRLFARPSDLCESLFNDDRYGRTCSPRSMGLVGFEDIRRPDGRAAAGGAVASF